MTAEYNAVNARAELLGDGFGWQRMRVQTPTPPLGTKQAIYVMRVETDLAAPPAADTDLSWNAASYFGFKFDANFPSSSEEDHADYDNFFGAAGDEPSAPFDQFDPVYGSSADTVAFGLDDSGNSSGGRMYNGNGGTLDASISVSDYPYTLGAAPSKFPNVVNQIWRVYSHPTDNSILYETWMCEDSIDMTTFDIANDMDPQDPKAFFPPLGTPKTGILHGDTFGTNWRPSDGVMGFPTYFMACHPGRTFNMYIPYVGVQYSTLTA